MPICNSQVFASALYITYILCVGMIHVITVLSCHLFFPNGFLRLACCLCNDFITCVMLLINPLINCVTGGTDVTAGVILSVSRSFLQFFLRRQEVKID